MDVKDNGGRRTGQRRQVFEEIDFDERRNDSDRRIVRDRRCGFDRRTPLGFRHLSGMDRRKCYRFTKYAELFE